jgi:hypothetical protein
MDIIERAARAAAKSSIGDERFWRDCIDDVHAVLSALREPNWKMIEAGTDYRPINPRDRAKYCWQAMIDQALKG